MPGEGVPPQVGIASPVRLDGEWRNFKVDVPPAAKHSKGSAPANHVSRRGFAQHSLAVAVTSLAAESKAGGELLGIGKPTAAPHKRRSIADYRQNMEAFGGRLSASHDLLHANCSLGKPWQYDIAVIGSGYGASITAARLAQAMRPGVSLCLLERGREWIPGTFPDRLPEVTDQARLKIFGRQRRELNNPTGLFNLLQCDDISILSGSGLGGSSLINASVALRPDPEVFLQTEWPNALRDMQCLGAYFDRAEWELHARQEPTDWTCKMRAQRLAAERLADHHCHFEAAAVTVMRSQQDPHLPILNRQGMLQRNCIDCGDCITGCNVGAKNTLATNYLPMACRAGAVLFSQTEVRCLEKLDGYYRIHYLFHALDASGKHQSYPGCLTARLVVLGAGSIGSSEILLRSRSEHFSFSTQLGCHWTGNGDALGWVIRGDQTTCAAGVGTEAAEAPRIGPTIQTNVTYPCRPQLHDRVLIQEGAVPRAYARIATLLMQDVHLDHTLPLFGMGHDRQEGRIVLEDNQNGVVVWPGLLESPYRQKIRAEFARLAAAHGGRYKALRIFGDRMVSVHPLGGCGMSDDPRSGVTNHKGQVYDTRCGGDIDPLTGQLRVHEGLYVADGAIFPTAIACNPHLTISALAERNAQLMTREPQFAELFEPQ
jgi:cholesterol oxidase